jgi:uncharacterized membrane protein YeaQ/YmgE (transglycosylase-associated protein family)
MGCLVLMFIMVAMMGLAMWFTVTIFGLMLTLFVAGLIGALADVIVPGHLPGGWLGAVLTGIAGGFVGHLLMGLLHIPDPGPQVFGVHVIPAFIGAVVIAVVAQLVSSSGAGRYMQ